MTGFTFEEDSGFLDLAEGPDGQVSFVPKPYLEVSHCCSVERQYVDTLILEQVKHRRMYMSCVQYSTADSTA